MRSIALAFALVTSGLLAAAAAEEPRAPGAVVRMKIIDVDVTNARKLKVDVRAAGNNPPPSSALADRILGKAPEATTEGGSTDSFVISQSDVAFGVIHALCKEQVASVLAEPTLASPLGQPARFRSGGEFPIPKDAAAQAVTMRFYGTELDVVATQRDAERGARVTFGIHLSQMDPSRGIKVGKFDVPALRVYETQNTFDAKWGETFVLCSKQPSQKKGSGDAHEILRVILVTPELVNFPAVAAKPTTAVQ